MRLSRILFVLARTGSVGALVMGLGCVGQIPSGGDSKNPGPGMAPGGSGPTPGGGSGGGGSPIVDPPASACAKPPLSKPRIWRLTKTQIRNTLTDVANFSPPSVDKLPSETRLDGEFA